MTIQYSEGPWSYSLNSDGSATVFDADDQPIAIVLASKTMNTEDNAQLIASAPEMYEASK